MGIDNKFRMEILHFFEGQDDEEVIRIFLTIFKGVMKGIKHDKFKEIPSILPPFLIKYVIKGMEENKYYTLQWLESGDPMNEIAIGIITICIDLMQEDYSKNSIRCTKILDIFAGFLIKHVEEVKKRSKESQLRDVYSKIFG